MVPTPAPDETLDLVCAGRVQVIQHRHGYRFAVDSVLLGYFAGRPRGRVCDLGTGCGVIPLVVASRSPEAQIVGVELQEDLFHLAVRNIELNRVGDRVEVMRADLRRVRGLMAPDSFDLVLSNPPYHPAPDGWLSPVAQRAAAKHELFCSLSDVAQSARFLLKGGGHFKIVFPAGRATDLIAILRANSLEPKRLRFVHPRPSGNARLVLCESVKGARAEVQVLPPLVLNDESGKCIAEIEALLDGA